MRGRRERRRKQVLDELKEKRGYNYRGVQYSKYAGTNSTVLVVMISTNNPLVDPFVYSKAL